MALAAAAVCPHPPLLIPEVGVGVRLEARDAALAAVVDLVAGDPDLVVVIGSGPEVVSHTSAAFGSLAGFGVDEVVPLGVPPGDDEAVLPLSITVGAWLLQATGWTGARSAFSAPDTLSSEVAAGHGRELAGLDDRVALLCMGDASARRSEKAPGWLDPRAEAFDAYVATALANADCEALLRLDVELARELLVAGRASWQILAGAAAGRSWCSRLLYAEAPFGVGYLVATWTDEQ